MPTPAAPLYFRIQEMLRLQIISGQLTEGARIPSETELADRFETTRGTVRQALAQLTFEGLITRRMGLGTFVASRRMEGRIEAQRPRSFEEQMAETGARIGFRLLGFDSIPASSAIARTLNIVPATPVLRLRRLRLVDDEIIGYEDRSMLDHVGAAIPAAALATKSAVAMVELGLGTPLGGMTVSVGAEPAPPEIAHALGIRAATPLLVRSHVFFAQDGAPILTGDSMYRGDKYRFTYQFGRSPS